MHPNAVKCRKMAEFEHSEPDLASQPQPRYLPLVPMGSLLGQWPLEVTFFLTLPGNFAVNAGGREKGKHRK
jgi:hypothetical protein